MKHPVIIDTDLSFDDFVAILFLLHHPEIEVRAITVVNGVVHVQPGVENARRLLALAGRSNVPVAAGFEGPLARERGFPSGWRLLLDYGPRFTFPRAQRSEVPREDAVSLICRQVMESEQPITLVALGPLTNLALALEREPALAHRLQEIVISGGAIDVPGTIPQDIHGHPNSVAEWNFYLDPASAAGVLTSGTAIRLVPLDVTHVTGPQPLLFGREFVKSLPGSAQGKAGKQLAQILRIWQMMSPQFAALPVWDGAVAALVADPTIGTEWRDMGLRVVQGPEALAGQTVVDQSLPPNVRVCMKGNQAALEAAYTAVLRAPSSAI